MNLQFLQAASVDPGISNIIFFGGVILVFYFFMIRPQIKKTREQGNFMNELKKGDEVVTSSGIVGKINKIDKKIITLESSKTYIDVLKSSISKDMTDSLKEKVQEKKKLFG